MDMRPFIKLPSAAIHLLHHLRLEDWIDNMDDRFLAIKLNRIYRHYDDLWPEVPGSSHNHQAWRAGLRDHLAAMCRLGWVAYHTETQLFGDLPFTFDDVVVCIFCHDAEKLVKNGSMDDPRCAPYLELHQKEGAPWEAVKFHLLDEWQERFGLKLTQDHMNALHYTHGEPDSEYRKDRRVMNELASFVHRLDNASARTWHSHGQFMG